MPLAGAEPGRPDRHHPVLVRAGSLDNERKTAEAYNYKIESRAINGIASIVMRANDPTGLRCGQ